jgi:hypothetical protein
MKTGWRRVLGLTIFRGTMPALIFVVATAIALFGAHWPWQSAITCGLGLAVVGFFSRYIPEARW